MYLKRDTAAEKNNVVLSYGLRVKRSILLELNICSDSVCRDNNSSWMCIILSGAMACDD